MTYFFRFGFEFRFQIRFEFKFEFGFRFKFWFEFAGHRWSLLGTFVLILQLVAGNHYP